MCIRDSAKSVYSLEARSAIGKLIEDVRPDIVHSHNVYHHLTPAIFGAIKSKGVPNVMTVHDLKIGCPSKLMLASDGVCERCKGGKTWNAVQQRCLKGSLALSAVAAFETTLHRMLGSYRKNVDLFIIPSHFHAAKLSDWGLPADKTRYLPNAVDVTEMVPNYAAGKRFVFVGRLSEEKGLATFVEAVGKSGVAATIVGTGPQEQELRDIAERTGADVEFVGYQTGEALFSLIAESRALVLPSECYENAPVVLLEAYGMGKPVIGSDLGGIPELIDAGSTGLLAKAGDVESFATVLRSMHDMGDDEIAQMGRAGREFVEERFTREQYLEGLLDIYRELGAH